MTRSNARRAKGPWLFHAWNGEEHGEVIVMSQDKLITPEQRVRRLQEKLHRSAKHEPARRFHQLYDKVYSPWFLDVAWRRVAANKGAAGPDGVTIESVREQGVAAFVQALSVELRERRYRTGPVRRVYIPKPNGKLRPLGIPNVRDRVVQMATLLVLEPIFEADLPDEAYGFRPGRSAHQAIDKITWYLYEGRTDVVDADLSSYFDTIPHDNLMKLVARRIVDRGILNLLKQWLEAPVIEPDDKPGSAGRKRSQGTPQGGVISPLLANLYHACIPHLWKRRGFAATLGGRMVAYADDFVILLPPGRGAAALEALRGICARLSLTLSEEKTRVADAVSDGFAFLGFQIRKDRNSATGKWYGRVWPSPKSETRVREKVADLLNRTTHRRPASDVIGDVNHILRGWQNYFWFGQPQRVMRRLKHFVEQRFRKWLMRRSGRRGPGYTRYPTRRLYEEFSLHSLPTARPLRARERLRGEGTRESRMRETCTSGLMRGRWKRSHGKD
jgi:RNA-directed DNA polymerase